MRDIEGTYRWAVLNNADGLAGTDGSGNDPEFMDYVAHPTEDMLPNQSEEQILTTEGGK